MKRVQLFLAAIIVVFASCEQNGPKEPMGSLNGHECVDLGLSVKWATMNVGAQSPEKCGWLFAWGETKIKNEYTLQTYFSPVSEDGFTLKNDAAHANWGGRWRMPTEEEWKELQAYCTWDWTIQNGIEGYLVTSMTNQNSIFLPCTHGARGYYWSSSSIRPYPNGPYHPIVLNFTNSITRRDNVDAYEGYAVRPVCR